MDLINSHSNHYGCEAASSIEHTYSYCKSDHLAQCCNDSPGSQAETVFSPPLFAVIYLEMPRIELETSVCKAGPLPQLITFVP